MRSRQLELLRGGATKSYRAERKEQSGRLGLAGGDQLSAYCFCS